MQWLRDQLGIIGSADEIEALAASVEDTGDVYFVPAFSGLFAPRWREDARGAIVGLTAYTTAATSPARRWRRPPGRRARCSTPCRDAGVALRELKVDGGMTANELLMQFQADVLGVPVVRPEVVETTALGAAYAAGLAVGVWDSLDDVRANWREGELGAAHGPRGSRARVRRLEEGRHADLRLGGARVTLRVEVVGPGAVGSFLGATLARAGHDVTLVGRSEVPSPGRGELRLVEAGGETRVPVTRAGIDDAAAEAPDVVLLAVKLFDLAPALATVERWPDARCSRSRTGSAPSRWRRSCAPRRSSPGR